MLRTPDGQPGLAVQYFAGVDFDRLVGKTVDTNLEHAWPGPPLANPPPGLDGFDNFSARFPSWEIRWEDTSRPARARLAGPFQAAVVDVLDGVPVQPRQPGDMGNRQELGQRFDPGT